jgi:hypothetical protein
MNHVLNKNCLTDYKTPSITVSDNAMTLQQYKCERCNHIWLPRVEGFPRRCPNCGNSRWYEPYKLRPWTLAEEEYLKNNAHLMSWEVLAKRLGKPVEGVKRKAYRLGLRKTV